MKKLVVDASVAVKWFVPEVHSAAAAGFLDADVILAAPDLIGPEFTNTVWKKVRRGELSPEDAVEILAAFSRVPLDIQPSAPLLRAAFDIAEGTGRSVYDSLYVATAVAWEAELVTADLNLYDALAAGPFKRHVRWVDKAL